MNAADQDAIARILHDAFDGRVVVSRPVRAGGNLKAWEEQSPQSMIAAWLQLGWCVDLVRGTVDERQLRLVPDDAVGAARKC